MEVSRNDFPVFGDRYLVIDNSAGRQLLIVLEAEGKLGFAVGSSDRSSGLSQVFFSRCEAREVAEYLQALCAAISGHANG